MGSNLIGPAITTVGLLCDIVGAVLVAIEVVRVFRGPTTIDIGGSGTVGGGFIPKANPDFEKHEKEKHRIMWWGLGMLLLGFTLQGVGTWWLVLIAP